MRLLNSALLHAAGFAHAFPERGFDEAELCVALAVPAIAQAKQVHGARAVEATEVAGAEADAIVARAPTSLVSPGAAAGVRVADCVPILLGDEASGSVAAIHAGWRGVVAGVVRAGVVRLVGPMGGAAVAGAPADQFGRAVAGSIVAAVGPCIGACCFEVGVDVADSIDRACGGIAGVVVRRDGAKAFVDLRAAVRAQLAALGVSPARIDDVGGCTKHEPIRFHSFRRDGPSSGRMLAAIAARSYG
jgi:YfiH family protein